MNFKWFDANILFVSIYVSGSVTVGATSSTLSGCTICPSGKYNTSPGNGVICTDIASCTASVGYTGIAGACTCAAGYT